MKYRSTRDSSEASFSFEDVLFLPDNYNQQKRYAKDGGLYVPEFVPQISTDDLVLWKSLDYPGIVEKILQLYISNSEIEHGDIKDIVSSAYKSFELPEVVKLKTLEKHFIVAELFRGPTLAFKDLSLEILAKLLEFFLKKKKNEKLTILIGTSGDTGPAAARSVANLEKINLIMLYPLNRVSEIQELQMLYTDAENVHVCAVEGTSDDLDVPIKECFQDATFSKNYHLGSLNSIQWARVLLQTAHYIYIYLQCCLNIGDSDVTIVVPTGAAGNLAAGFLAHQMGIPIKLVGTVNANDILARSFQYGDCSTEEEVIATLAPAMDIQAPYNIERLLYFATKGNAEIVRKIMEQFETCGEVNLSQEILEGLRNVIIETVSVSDLEISLTIQRCYRQYQYVACPHTATAISYVFSRIDSSSKSGVCVCLATASPAKFPDAILSADIGIIPTNPYLEQLKIRSQSGSRRPGHFFRCGQDWTSQLKNIIENVQV